GAGPGAGEGGAVSARTPQQRQALALALALRQSCELRQSWGAPFGAWLARVTSLRRQALDIDSDPFDVAEYLASARWELKAAWEWVLGAADAACWVAAQVLALSPQQRARINDLAWQAPQHDWELHHAVRAAREAALAFSQAHAQANKASEE